MKFTTILLALICVTPSGSVMLKETRILVVVPSIGSTANVTLLNFIEGAWLNIVKETPKEAFYYQRC